MKVAIESKFLQPTDFNDGDEITVLDEGEEKEGQWGKKLNIGVKLPNGDEKIASVSNTSKKFMFELYGDDTADWIGKKVPLFKIKQMVGNSLKTVIYWGKVPGDEEGGGEQPNQEPEEGDTSEQLPMGPEE